MSHDPTAHNGLEPPDGMSRRDFVTLLGASMALAGLGGCVREPDRRILPYVSTPPDVVPGVPLHYATSMTLDGYATGLLVTSREGRPVKIEGNPSHPASLGASGALEQASLLQLYDPHRAVAPRAGRRRTTLAAARAALAPATLAKRVGARGAGLQLLLEPTASPLVIALLDEVRTRYPEARVSFFAPLESASPLVASWAAFGAPLLPHYDFRHADIVVSLGADVLADGPFHLRYAFDFAQHRGAAKGARLYVAETAPTPTGTLADRRLALPPSAIGQVAAALYSAVVDPSPAGAVGDVSSALAPDAREWVMRVARELATHPGNSLVVAGERQPAEVHLLAAALNDTLHDVGRAVWYSAPVIAEAGERSHDIATFAAGIDGGTDTLVVLDVNVCYAAPADLDLDSRLRAVRNSIYVGAYDDETARVATWHLPASHYLECWGDGRAYDGTLSLVQPLIAPLHESLSVSEVLAALAGHGVVNVHDLLHQRWSPAASGGASWEEALRLGLVSGSDLPRTTPALQPAAPSQALRAIATTSPAADTIEISITPGVVHDGRFADNAWLQELPAPVTSLTWDNAALLSPAVAAHEQLQTGDVVTLQNGVRSISLPALVVPGHADGAVTLAMGYGRSGAEAVARGVGVNVSALRTAATPFMVNRVRLTRSGAHRKLAITQEHWSLEGRGESILGEAPSAAASDAQRPRRRPLTLYEPPAPASTGFGADQWAMTIDLDRCTGCSACVVACQAENNVPVVGRDGVLDRREMHWLRIDRYVRGAEEAPQFVSQPMLCQQCEKAPCEYVCPVNATVHSDDGLNEMVYNRCVGTRFCSNNCPYKVRRFNWFDYNHELAETERMAKNPEVTIRARGVMEKCTFCVQRIRRAQSDARLAGEAETGPVVTACQQACPTRAIVFGSLTAPASEVAQLQNDPRSFAALGELGTLPRVRYLRREVRSTPTSVDENDER